MHGFFSSLRNMLFPPSPPKKSPEELRAAFARRYQYFRALLTANNNALQAMAELEKVYYSGESYRMAVIRSKINTILINVYKMISNLRGMAGGRYQELEEKFEIISRELNAIIEAKPEFRDGPLLLPLGDVSRREREQVGEKMANLGEISTVEGIRVPPGFVVTATATRRFLTSQHLSEINRRLQVLQPDDMDGLYKACDEIKKNDPRFPSARRAGRPAVCRVSQSGGRDPAWLSGCASFQRPR